MNLLAFDLLPAIVRQAVLHAKGAGCEWIHVDFDDGDRLAPST